MVRTLLTGLFFSIFSFGLIAQDTIPPGSVVNPVLQQMEEELKILAKVILTDSIKEQRIAANLEFQKLLVEALQEKGAFDYPFDSLISIPKLQPEDHSFRIFTWQLYEDINEYSYYGIIQMAGDEPQLHLLSDHSTAVANADLEYDIFGKENWYGALYYNMKTIESKNGKHYLLFGFDGYQFFHKRKLAEVLSFEDGQPVFGAPVFEPKERNRPDLTKNRIVLTYSAATTIRLNYDPSLDMIIFDNLIQNPVPIKGQGASMAPDGSYQGYKFDGNRLVHVEKIFDHVYEKAPRPQPILDDRTKDIMGNN